MKKLFEIVAERHKKQIELESLKKEFEAKEESLSFEIRILSKLENSVLNGCDVIKIQLAESVLEIDGNPYGNTDVRDKSLAERAIIDIANNNTQLLRRQFFGNKRYDGFYEEWSGSYGSGPTHGSIVDEVGLKRDARTRDLTDDEKDAAIYYLKNFTAIKRKGN
jgi:hypothetical protein